MEKSIDLDSDEGFVISHLAKRVQGLEDTITEAAISLRSARITHAKAVAKILLARAEYDGEQWSTEARPDGTVTIRYITPDEPPTDK